MTRVEGIQGRCRSRKISPRAADSGPSRQRVTIIACRCLNKTRVRTGLGNLDLLRVQVVRRTSISRWTGSLADVYHDVYLVFSRPPFPFCLNSLGHYEDGQYGAYLGHLPFQWRKAHDILGAADKDFPGTFQYLRIWPSICFPLHHDLLLCYTSFDFLSFYIKSCLFHLMSCGVKTCFACLMPWR